MKVNRRMAHKLVTITGDCNIKEALGLMKMHEIRHLPVVENGRFLGLVTESDIRAVHLAAIPSPSSNTLLFLVLLMEKDP